MVAFHARVADEDESHQRSLIESSKRAWVFVARSLAPVQKATRRLALTLTKAVLLATVLTLAGGYIIASYGTRPIREVADRIAGIEPGHPRLEIDASRVPLELDPIVQKTDLLLHRIDEELSRQRRLTADVAHDLRTPVAGVRALLDVCVQRERKPQEYVETIGAAQAALRQLSLLLDNVLTLARLDSNAERPLFAEVRLSDVIGDATAVLKPMTAVRQVAIRSVGEVDAVIPCDRAMLAKILTNLLANAVEYTSPNSLVTLAIERHETTLAIHVRDCGPGVPDAQREKIFDRFVRGDVARAGSANHSGLGLPIARGLARLLGGDVRLNPRSDLPRQRFRRGPADNPSGLRRFPDGRRMNLLRRMRPPERGPTTSRREDRVRLFRKQLAVNQKTRRCRAEGMPSWARYLATVRRAMGDAGLAELLDDLIVGQGIGPCPRHR